MYGIKKKQWGMSMLIGESPIIQTLQTDLQFTRYLSSSTKTIRCQTLALSTHPSG